MVDEGVFNSRESLPLKRVEDMLLTSWSCATFAFLKNKKNQKDVEITNSVQPS